MEGLMTVRVAADKWGVSDRWVRVYCMEGRIPGATKISDTIWMIPADALKPDDIRIRDKNANDSQAKPFLKWAGGKKQLIPEIEKVLPFKDISIKKYAEPFVGGGAVLFHILNNYELDQVYINDINRELINCYRVIRDNLPELTTKLTEMQSEYLPVNNDIRRGLFNISRSRFNELKRLDILDSNKVERAALMIYLNRTCFNGLYRENMKGDFNVPMGAYKSPIICDMENLQKVSKKLQNVEIMCCDYRGLDDFIDNQTFVYFDPPYRPLNTTSNFNSYTKDAFNDDSQRELAQYFKKLSSRGSKVALSNSDPKNTNPDDDFFDELYAGFSINRISASRMINSKASKRGKITELLITN